MTIQDSIAYKYADWCVDPENKKVGRYIKKQAQVWLDIADGKDAEAFVETIDELEAWGNKDDMFIYSEIISGQYLLDMWELEQGVSLYQIWCRKSCSFMDWPQVLAAGLHN